VVAGTKKRHFDEHDVPKFVSPKRARTLTRRDKTADTPEKTPLTNNKNIVYRQAFEERYGTNLIKNLLTRKCRATVVQVIENARLPAYAATIFKDAKIEINADYALRVRVEVFSDWLPLPKNTVEKASIMSTFPCAWARSLDSSQERPKVNDPVWVSLVSEDDFTTFLYEGRVAGDYQATDYIPITDNARLFNPCDSELEVSAVLSPVMGTPLEAVCGLDNPELINMALPEPIVEEAEPPKTLDEVAPPVGTLALPQTGDKPDTPEEVQPNGVLVNKEAETNAGVEARGIHAGFDSNPHPPPDLKGSGLYEGSAQYFWDKGYENQLVEDGKQMFSMQKNDGYDDPNTGDEVPALGPGIHEDFFKEGAVAAAIAMGIQGAEDTAETNFFKQGWYQAEQAAQGGP
jgi:hypothetical protein